MLNPRKSKAEQQFAAAQKQNKKISKEKNKARQQQAEKMARLRALRLAKEAADKEAIDHAGTKATPIASQAGSKLKTKEANDEDGDVDLLEIPSHLRRQQSR